MAKHTSNLLKAGRTRAVDSAALPLKIEQSANIRPETFRENSKEDTIFNQFYEYYYYQKKSKKNKKKQCELWNTISTITLSSS